MPKGLPPKIKHPGFILWRKGADKKALHWEWSKFVSISRQAISPCTGQRILEK
ncbi:MAG: hypothetical protein U5L00_21270 [Desulfovermiculus sp.]|nr:hypothetical protein [Desulfovermiculus sp.]